MEHAVAAPADGILTELALHQVKVDAGQALAVVAPS